MSVSHRLTFNYTFHFTYANCPGSNYIFKDITFWWGDAYTKRSTFQLSSYASSFYTGWYANLDLIEIDAGSVPLLEHEERQQMRVIRMYRRPYVEREGPSVNEGLRRKLSAALEIDVADGVRGVINGGPYLIPCVGGERRGQGHTGRMALIRHIYQGG